MSDENQKLCDVCHERPATQHICYGHTGETKDLCTECFEQTASPAELESFRHFDEVISSGKCKYCGAPAAGGSMTGYGAPGLVEEKTNFWCETCLRDLAEFAKLPGNAIPDDFDVEDEATMEQVSQQIVELERRKEEFMRQKIRERSQ